MSWINDEEFTIYLHEDNYSSIAEWMFGEQNDNFIINIFNIGNLTEEQLKQIEVVRHAVYEIAIVVNVKTGKIRLKE